MAKIKLDNSVAFLYPMPMVLVGAVVNGIPNFLPVAWITRVNYKPALLGITLGPHHTNLGIEEHKAFSVNIPDASLMEKTDYCGLVSGNKVDKSQVFSVFYGQWDKAPLIEECPVAISCSLYDVVKLPFNTLYIGEPQEVFTDEKYMTGKKLDIKKINPFTLTMPDNQYWSVGENLGKAWNVGKSLRKS